MSEQRCDNTDLLVDQCAHCKKIDLPKEQRTARCKFCGATEVTWTQSPAGNWVLRDLDGQGNIRNPHFLDCDIQSVASFWDD